MVSVDIAQEVLLAINSVVLTVLLTMEAGSQVFNTFCVFANRIATGSLSVAFSTSNRPIAHIQWALAAIKKGIFTMSNLYGNHFFTRQFLL